MGTDLTKPLTTHSVTPPLTVLASGHLDRAKYFQVIVMPTLSIFSEETVS